MSLHKFIASYTDLAESCRSYSGRGMMGKQCLGVDCSLNDFMQQMFSAIADHPTEYGRIEDELRVIETDSMGRGWIVYFQRAQFDKRLSEDCCPGCGCEAGDGVTEGCDDEDGCGYYKQLAKEDDCSGCKL